MNDYIPSEKIQIRTLGKLSVELQYALGAESVNIQTPVPGKKEVGISIARDSRRIVTLGDVINVDM